MERKGYFDARAIDLISRWEPPPAPKEPQIRAAMSDFCLRAEANERAVALHAGAAPSRASGSSPERRTTATARATACSCTAGRRRRRRSRCPIPRATTTRATETPGTTSTGTAGHEQVPRRRPRPLGRSRRHLPEAGVGRRVSVFVRAPERAAPGEPGLPTPTFASCEATVPGRVNNFTLGILIGIVLGIAIERVISLNTGAGLYCTADLRS